MAGKSITLRKSKDFAIRIVKLYQHLSSHKQEFVLSKQLLRSGTSIGANLSEALYGISYRDFLSKVFISLKESAETKYWIDILYSTGYLTQTEYESIDNDCTELIKLLTATAKSCNKKLSDTK